MKVLHFGSIDKNKASGLSFSIPNFIESQNLEHTDKIAFLFNTNKASKKHIPQLKDYDVIVLHSFFIKSYFKLLLRLPKHIKIIICPHGAFSKSNKYDLKKRLYAFFYFSIIRLRNLRYSIHFLTVNEMKRSRFRCERDFVIGNCINLETGNSCDKHFLRMKFNNKNIVYIGRFDSHIKGLDLLFKIIIDSKKIIKDNNIKIDFYGPDSINKKQLIDLSEQHNLTTVSFHNAVFGIKKQEVLKNASFHILNSRSEGFPMSVLESAVFYTPQLLSKGTNLQETMLSESFGLSVNNLLFEMISTVTFDDYKKMALNARVFSENHSLKNIGRKINKRYFQ